MTVRSIAKRLPLAQAFLKISRDSFRRAFFERAYRTGDWGPGCYESKSGPGSDLDQTEAVREALPALIAEFGIRTLLDLPCGDFHWMRYVDLKGAHYIGADIVPDMITANRRLYDAPGIEFRLLDITCQALPTVDLILCRDCLVHLSNRLVAKALEQIKKSRSHYLLATTFPGNQNADIATGGWRPIDMTATPHLLPTPIRLIGEGNPDIRFRNKSLGFWNIATI